MAVTPQLSLIPRAGLAPDRSSLVGRGFALEHVELESVPEFEYRKVGSAWYLALHDIVLSSGAAAIEGGPSSSQADLRNTITLLPADAGISGWSKPQARRNSFTALYFDPVQLDPELDRRFRRTNLHPVLYGRDANLEATLRKLQAAMRDPSNDSLYVEHLCFVAAVEALGLAAPDSPGSLSPRQLGRVLDYLHAHYREDLGLSDLASVAGLSRFHFVRAFKRSTGRTPYAYLREVRLERANLLLTTTSTAISLIAVDCGFRDLAGLRRALKAAGKTASQFR